MRKSLVAALALTACVAVSGCMSSPAPSPVPAPTFACTPEAGGAEHPCNEREYHEMKAQDALYLEAEQVYRAFSRERERVFRAGGEADEQLLSQTHGSATEAVRDSHADRARFEGGSISIAWIRRNVGLSRDGSLVSLESCVDASSAAVFVDGKPDGPGLIVRERSFFGRVNGTLKMVALEYKVVDSCLA